MRKNLPKGTLFTPQKSQLPGKFSQAQRVKNILRNTTGQGARINLNGSVTIFGGK